PTREEQERVPHFGLDLVLPNEPFNAGDFVDLADRVLAEHPRVIVAGGTSLYIQALIRGLVKTPQPDRELRQTLEEHPDLHAELTRLDPELAKRLHPNDSKRLIRGLEVVMLGGIRLSELQAKHATEPDRLNTVALWLDRDDLPQRIETRVHQMVAQGYLHEVQGLLDDGYDSSLKPMQSLGYRHICAHTRGEFDLDNAIELTIRATRRFSRKQRTWMRSLEFPRAVEDHLLKSTRAAQEAFTPQP
ncbi:MAG TPA: tRNA (adenosine(37)-N6)-dimethylallyltransferase MiaA, partial [Planctomycetes bacterium]|nr:tRNA (adenosine(37)-N6)-dimethylallyltransferase MiaA [Planctomycetota bacterium]